MIEFINNDKEKIELYKYEILKNVIKDNVVINDNGEVDSTLYLSDEIIKAIRYTDTKFYNELKQQKAGQ